MTFTSCLMFFLAVGANGNLGEAENWWHLGKRMHRLFGDSMLDLLEEDEVNACLDFVPEDLLLHTGSANSFFGEVETRPQRIRLIGRIPKEFASEFHADDHDLDGPSSLTCSTRKVDDNLDYVCRDLPPSDLAANRAHIQVENWRCLGERVLTVLKASVSELGDGSTDPYSAPRDRVPYTCRAGHVIYEPESHDFSQEDSALDIVPTSLTCRTNTAEHFFPNGGMWQHWCSRVQRVVEQLASELSGFGAARNLQQSGVQMQELLADSASDSSTKVDDFELLHEDFTSSPQLPSLLDPTKRLQMKVLIV